MPGAPSRLALRVRPVVGVRRITDRRHHQQIACARSRHVGQPHTLLAIALDFLRLVIEQIERRPAGEPEGAQAARRIDETTGRRPMEPRGRIAEDDDRKLQPLGPVHRHDPHAVAPLLQNRRFTRLPFRRLVAQMLDEAPERQPAARFVDARHLADLQHVGEHLLAGPLHHERCVRPGLLQKLPDSPRDGNIVAAAMQPAQQLQGVGDRQESFDVGNVTRRHRRGDAEGVEATEAVPVCEERFVVDGEQRSAQGREDGELVIGPLDGGQRGAQRPHLFALVKRPAADQQVPNPARLERVDVGPRHVGAPTVETPEEQGDVPCIDRYALLLGTLRSRARSLPGHGPAALAHQPVDEGADGIGEGHLDGLRGHASAVPVRARHRQRHHARLGRFVWTMRSQRYVAGRRRARITLALPPGVVRVLRSPHQRRERPVDQALYRGHRTEARGESDACHAAARESGRHLPIHAHVGATETVDRLPGVADQEELADAGGDFAPVPLGRIGRRQQQQDLGLQGIGVLELVDEDADVALLRVVADIVVVAEQVPRPKQQIDEIESSRLGLQAVIALDGIVQLLLQVRRQVGVGHLRERPQDVHDLRVSLEDVGPGNAPTVL